MADTRIQREVESWVVREALRVAYRQAFAKGAAPLAWGGTFEFDAVSHDRTIVACVSTSVARTAGNKLAVGKIRKIKADALYLLSVADVKRRVLVFTDESMLRHFENERKAGRFPPETDIELRLVELPSSLAARLAEARAAASAEVTPRE
ncbi:hypothetical protein FJY63_12950 [Candidatus Sumerlaeota bacterium]|nr:hypothetical protein [Candidatus Sumerlaeota bacterium]